MMPWVGVQSVIVSVPRGAVGGLQSVIVSLPRGAVSWCSVSDCGVCWS